MIMQFYVDGGELLIPALTLKSCGPYEPVHLAINHRPGSSDCLSKGGISCSCC